MIARLLLFAGFLLGAALGGLAQEGAGDIVILAAWARATPGPTAAVYLEVQNKSVEGDRLIDASASIARRTEIHEHRTANGVISMTAIPDIPLPAGATVRLAPGERYLMLFGLDKPLKPGDRFSLSLTFERSGTIVVEAVTGGAGALLPPS